MSKGSKLINPLLNQIKDVKTLGEKLRELPAKLIPVPDSGHFAKDICFLFLICAVQFTLSNSVLRSFVYLNLATSWLIVSIVKQSTAKGLSLVFLAAIIMEGSSLVPRGLYFCVYLLMFNVIVLIKDTVSWRYPITWGICFAAAELWTTLFEAFVSSIVDGKNTFTFFYACSVVLRVLLSTGFGMLMVFYWVPRFRPEPVEG